MPSVPNTRNKVRNVLGLIISAYEVVDGVGVSQTLFDLIGPAEVPFLAHTSVSTTAFVLRDFHNDASGENTHQRGNLAKVTADSEVSLLVLVAVRNDNMGARLRYNTGQ